MAVSVMAAIRINIFAFLLLGPFGRLDGQSVLDLFNKGGCNERGVVEGC